MILAIRTAEAVSELYLLGGDGIVVKSKRWSADRRLAKELLSEIEQIIDGDWDELSGLIVYAGPGSFTGLRIGIATMNTLAYARGLPIVAASGEHWLGKDLKRLSESADDKIVLPQYGAPAKITPPK
jgi:tRNA threonylcarbamoyladenosine biosynthesis protein TsaB